MACSESDEKAKANLGSAKSVLAGETDPDMRELAKEEIADLEPRCDALEEELKMLLVPKDPEDEKDVIFEIRSGTGGDEAALFAGDLYNMYKRYCEQKRWKFEVTEVSEGAQGGYREVSINISGEDSKSGIAPDGLPDMLAAVAGYPRLRLRGLMTLPAPESAPGSRSAMSILGTMSTTTRSPTRHWQSGAACWKR